MSSEFLNFFRGLIFGLKHSILFGHTVKQYVTILPGYEKYRFVCICGKSIEFIYE